MRTTYGKHSTVSKTRGWRAARDRPKGRVTKYEHWLGEAFNFSRPEEALVSVLLLRGPQTPGELRSRTERIHRFDEISDVLAGLQKLMERDPPLGAMLPRQPGTKESRYAHLFSGPVESMVTTNAEPAPSVDSGASDERVAAMEAAIEELRREVAELRQKIDNLLA